MTRRRFLVHWAAIIIVVLGGLLGLGSFLTMRQEPATAAANAASPADAGQPAHAEPSANNADLVPVQTIRARADPSLRVTVEQPAYVQAYYTADLMARVAGPIKYLEKDIGDRITAGENLVQIDVPDLEEDVKLKEAILLQREQELKLAEADVPRLRAGVSAAEAGVKFQESEVQRAESTRSFREKELRRFRQLLGGPSPGVTAEVVDERSRDYEAAAAAVQGTRASVQKARADQQEAEAKLQAALVDVQLKMALVAVAGKDRDHAKAYLSYATLLAPFDGVVLRRVRDPGSFVQNASTGHSEPILTVARTDIVTVYMKLPDNYAPFVTRDTEALIEFSELPGWQIQAKVTRFSPSLITPEHDRTMRVEVDLYNGSWADYERLLERARANHNAQLKGRLLPQYPMVDGKPTSGLEGKLLPGMFGKMTLVLHRFQDARLIPSSALLSQGGQHFLFLVRDGRVAQVPVKVLVDDGRVANVLLLEKSNGQVIEEQLTGKELIVASNQGELSDGQAVRAAEPSPW